ncbi:glycosyltransferase family 2 protein [Nocardioides sp. GXQ0305]|uniref:glycosyltransferase family 2 protein n=1 Tax=Nocardioides sp. GXQ0305 TaxID=3423912 RepID=UPI003D7CD80B
MRLLRRRAPLLGVVVPVYNVEKFLPACLDSLLDQTHRDLDVVVVDDGSPDRSGEIAEQYAARDRRVRVVHTENRGLGAARNEGLRHVRGDLLAFFDSDDVLPPGAYALLRDTLAESGSDFVTASFVRWENGGYLEPRWMRRLHRERRLGITAEDHPEILGDVFAWDKMFRRDFWDRADLRWPESTRYEDQPTTTAAYLRGRFDVIPDHVVHWRIHPQVTAATKHRASEVNLRDRFETKRMALAVVRAEGSATIEQTFLERVLPGDMWRHFLVIPEASEEWWDLLVSGVREFWGSDSLVNSGLPPVHRLCGWLVEQGRRDEAAALMSHVAAHPAPLPRATDPATGAVRLDVPDGLVDLATVDPAALALRPHEL